MKKLLTFFSLLSTFFSFAQTTCTPINNTFKSNEIFSYKIYYSWGAIWVAAGEASFSAVKTELNNQHVYHFIGLGSTYPKYDWFYKVNDKYESYADTLTLKPLRFKREAREGGNYTFDDYVFNGRKKKVYTASKRDSKPIKYDSLSITSCTNDVLTAIYYTRCIDFSSYKIKDTIPVTFVLDGEVFPSYVRYLGTEVIHSETLGDVRCIKFRPKLIAGTLFKGGEGMTVWVTDDKNRMPVYVETPIVVGTIKVHLLKYSGLRNKLDCLVEKKAIPSKKK
ncbi:MAG: hypothetical protein K0S44_2429 [Bacteroidetes bacterium]|jgi:hypothetical protein|nr:hypothetical protein [Bacteroidota bacterium]